ncbi:MAG: bifunctional aspartate kinase/homoserine dehydrogenase I, partial [Bacteroidota bacterium]
MNVLKFGGTSVANAQHINLVIDIITKAAKKQKIAVVVSAFGNTTNMLLKTAELAAVKDEYYKSLLQEIENRHIQVVKDLIPITEQSAIISHTKRLLNYLETLYEGCYLLRELTPKTLATIASFGELLSSYIISEVMRTRKLNSEYKDSRELIITSESYENAHVLMKLTHENCKAFFEANEKEIIILPGFIAATEKGETTTLGRGGSDYTAAIIAAAVDANELQIWTDVSGMYTANPRIVKQATPIPNISYQEAMELSHFGAKVIYPPTIQPVLKKEIPILVKNTFAPEQSGTCISKNPNGKQRAVKGISYIENISLLTLEGSGMIGIPGFSKRLFETLLAEQVNIILITQASSEHSICIGINDKEASKAKMAIDKTFAYEISSGKVEPILVEQQLAIIALVGENMKNHQGLSGKMFSMLGKNNVNIRAIAQGASEKNISAVINSDDAKKALNALHEEFFEEKIKQLNLFVAGVGNVGERFLAQLHQQQEYLREQLKLNIRVIGISNSRTMLFDEEEIDLKNWKDHLAKGIKADLEKFHQMTISLNLRNSIFIDITASHEVSKVYDHYLQENISVVTCNKIACASEYKNYQNLKHVSRKYNVPFLFETNVGAGLPIIDTLKNVVASGDRIHKIQAVLSGSLNFVFNNFNSTKTFHDVVSQAQKEGYTEP